ncbi:tetratricopeptide repeat protein [Bdellovibrio sp. HCB337]|uniref:tetratricopeptide repeat protein n=1 Tax=Bdellovibrio sp. HCB337 TaxID=3394358 RepID=UPI0039A77D26
MKWILSISILSLGLTGCLKTRTDVRETEQKQVIQQEVTKLQRTNADVSSRFADVEEDMRNLRGRMEVLEHKDGQGNKEAESAKKFAADQSADANKKILLLQEGLSALEKTVFQLNAEVNGLKAEKAAMVAQASAAQAKAATEAKKGTYELAQESFEQKDWKKAILNYQKYRDENPNGKKFPDATYKMGVSFQELGMKDEAKTFYDELISRFPTSNEAKKAKIRLKGLKK